MPFGVDSRKCICMGLVNLEVNFFLFFFGLRARVMGGFVEKGNG